MGEGKIESAGRAVHLMFFSTMVPERYLDLHKRRRLSRSSSYHQRLILFKPAFSRHYTLLISSQNYNA
jgi:hypothetical protein